MMWSRLFGLCVLMFVVIFYKIPEDDTNATAHTLAFTIALFKSTAVSIVFIYLLMYLSSFGV